LARFIVFAHPKCFDLLFVFAEIILGPRVRPCGSVEVISRRDDSTSIHRLARREKSLESFCRFAGGRLRAGRGTDCEPRRLALSVSAAKEVEQVAFLLLGSIFTERRGTRLERIHTFKLAVRFPERSDCLHAAPFKMYSVCWGAFDSAKNHKRQRRKRQSVTAKREKSQTPKFV